MRYDLITDEGPFFTITRKFMCGDAETLAVGCTREEAREHCSDKESSSRTCTHPNLVELTALKGPWFDCFTEE